MENHGTILFTDDIFLTVVVGENREDVNNKLDEWRLALE